jgi:hypothetical protein
MQAGLSRQPDRGACTRRARRTEEEFLRIMEEQQRLIYELEITRTYGLL